MKGFEFLTRTEVFEILEDDDMHDDGDTSCQYEPYIDYPDDEVEVHATRKFLLNAC